MIRKNFRIADSIALEQNDKYIDLHNNFDFTKMIFSLEENTLELTWTKSDSQGAKDEPHKSVKLFYQDVSVFSIHGRNQKVPMTEDKALSFIGYLHPDDLSAMDGFLPPELAEDDFHMILGFESGMSIKVYAHAVEMETKRLMY